MRKWQKGGLTKYGISPVVIPRDITESTSIPISGSSTMPPLKDPGELITYKNKEQTDLLKKVAGSVFGGGLDTAAYLGFYKTLQANGKPDLSTTSLGRSYYNSFNNTINLDTDRNYFRGRRYLQGDLTGEIAHANQSNIKGEGLALRWLQDWIKNPSLNRGPSENYHTDGFLEKEAHQDIQPEIYRQYLQYRRETNHNKDVSGYYYQKGGLNRFGINPPVIPSYTGQDNLIKQPLVDPTLQTIAPTIVPQLHQIGKPSVDEVRERIRKNALYQQTHPYTQIDEKGNLSPVNPERGFEGQSLSPRAKQTDKGLDHFMGAIDAASIAMGAGAAATNIEALLRRRAANKILSAIPQVAKKEIVTTGELFSKNRDLIDDLLKFGDEQGNIERKIADKFTDATEEPWKYSPEELQNLEKAKDKYWRDKKAGLSAWNKYSLPEMTRRYPDNVIYSGIQKNDPKLFGPEATSSESSWYGGMDDRAGNTGHYLSNFNDYKSNPQYRTYEQAKDAARKDAGNYFKKSYGKLDLSNYHPDQLLPKNKRGGLSTMGYRDDSPYRNRASIDINTPNGIIDMSQTGIPLYAEDETGYGKVLNPYSGQHPFPGTKVRETPMQKGGMPYDPVTNPTGVKIDSRVFTGDYSNKPGEPISRRDDFTAGLFSESAAGGEKRMNTYGALGDLYRYYGGLPLQNSALQVSTYRPKNSKDPNAKYIAIKDDKFRNEVLQNYNRVFLNNQLNPGETKINDSTYAVSGYTRPSIQGTQNRKGSGDIFEDKGNKHVSNAIGNYFLSRGSDEKGPYVSYYDQFNANKPGETEWGDKLGLTKGFEIYDRIYLDQPKKQGGNIYQKDGITKAQFFKYLFEDDKEEDDDIEEPTAPSTDEVDNTNNQQEQLAILQHQQHRNTVYNTMGYDPTTLAPLEQPSSTPSVTSDASTPPTGDKAQYAYEYFKQKGLPSHVAAGIVGNLIQESGNFRDDVIAGTRKGDSGLATGIAQWHKPRWDQAQEWAKENGVNIYSLKGQLDYVLHEANQRGDLQKTLQTSSPEEAAVSFAKSYERPKIVDNNRARNARRLNPYKMGGLYNKIFDNV